MCKYLTGGSDKEAIALAEQAIRLSPRDPSNGWWYTWIGFVHLLQSRVDEAIASLEKSRSLDPRAWNTLYFLAIAHGLKGEKELAVAEMAEAQKLIGSGPLFEHRPLQSQWRPLHSCAAGPNRNGVLPRCPRRRIAGTMTPTRARGRGTLSLALQKDPVNKNK